MVRGSHPVIDHRWRQNVVRRKKWQTRRSLGVSSMFLPWFDVFCDLFLNRRTATLILSCFIKQRSKLVQKKAFHVWNLPIWLERRPLPKMAHMMREIWRDLLFMQITSVTMASKKKLVQGNHVSEKLDSIVTPRGMKTYSEIKVNCEIYSTNLIQNAGNFKSGFVIVPRSSNNSNQNNSYQEKRLNIDNNRHCFKT